MTNHGTSATSTARAAASQTSGNHPHRRHPGRVTLVAAGAVVLALAGTGTVWASTRSAPDQTQGAPHVQEAIDGLVDDLGFPGALAHVVDADGVAHNYTAGVGDLDTGAKVPVDGLVRIASNTKVFTATVVLQLVGEGLVELDEPIETYLPGLVRGDGIDGTRITVRQLLDHTSGLPDYTEHMDPDAFALRDVYVPQRHHTDVAFAQVPELAPGEQWDYSNTNYVVLGMLIEAVTRRPLAEQTTERIIEPLGLKHTYVPGPGERELRGAHPRGYYPDTDGELGDITELDPSWPGAAGDVVSTPSELLAFFEALIGGELLGASELAEMRTLVDMPQDHPGDGYGLGLIRTTLSCGVVLWGHGGDIQGYHTRGGVTEDGRGVFYAVTSPPMSMETHYAMEDTVDAIVCGLTDVPTRS